MSTNMNEINLSRLGSLLHLVDPNLPIGGFNHSGGLETFVQQKKVHNVKTLREYLLSQLQQNWNFNDGAYMSLSYDLIVKKRFEEIIELDIECSANKPARELRESSEKLGLRLWKIYIRNLEQNECIAFFHEKILNKETAGNYAILFGIIAATLQLDKAEALYAFYYNLSVGTITNGVKLIPLSQMDGQDILFGLNEDILNAVQGSLNPNQETLGATALMSEIRAMQHEQLYSRLYMS